METPLKKIIEIAIRFEAALKDQGVTVGDEKIRFGSDDIYFLLCLVMPDPKKLVWGDPRIGTNGNKV